MFKILISIKLILSHLTEKQRKHWQKERQLEGNRGPLLNSVTLMVSHEYNYGKVRWWDTIYISKELADRQEIISVK